MDARLRSLFVQVRVPGGAPSSLVLRFLPEATIADLARAVAEHFETSGPSALLALDHPTWVLPNQARVINSQIRHGSQLYLVDDLPGVEFVLLPALDPNDLFRLVHETGIQRGFGWGVGPNRRARMKLDERSSSLTACRDTDEFPDVEVEVSTSDSVTVIVSKDIVASVNGHYFSGSSEVGVGASIVLFRNNSGSNGDGDARSVHLVIYRTSEHDMLRVPGETAFRRYAPVGDLEYPEAVALTVPSFTAGTKPEFDWLDEGLQAAPTLLFPIFFLFSSGWIGLVGLAFPIAGGIRTYRRWKKHKERLAEYERAPKEWARRVGIEIGVLRDRVLAENAYLEERFLDVPELFSRLREIDPQLWRITNQHPDYLQLSLGRGSRISQSSLQISGGFQTEGDTSALRAQVENARLSKNSKIVVSLRDKNLAVIGPLADTLAVTGSLMAQIAYDYSPIHLTVAVFLPESAEPDPVIDWVLWLPHLRSPSSILGSERVVIGRRAAARVLSDSIAAAHAASSDEHCVLLVHESAGIDIAILTQLLQVTKGRAHVIWIGASYGRVPGDISPNILMIGEPVKDNTASPVSTARQLTATLLPQEISVITEAVGVEPSLSAVLRVASLVDETTDRSVSSVPREVGLGNVALLNPTGDGQTIIDGWNTRTTIEEFIYLLGENGKGRFFIDILEEGPHMLVGGTTGAGKSEFLRSLLLTLCVNYSPKDVRLILIDFKGGSAFRDLEVLPHISGTVSNLEAYDVKRLILFLEAELLRRQRLLSAYSGEYREFRSENIQTILPRLLVVIDEFAGFVGTKDDYIDSIMRIAAQGRSLGIHLILATQRPQGAITPQITANVNARVALRTLDDDDSVSIIDTKSAAAIPATLPGRAFIRLDSGGVHEFQAPFTKSRYLEGVRRQRRVAVDDLRWVVELTRGTRNENASENAGEYDITVVIAELAETTGTLARRTGREVSDIEQEWENGQPSLKPAFSVANRKPLPTNKLVIAAATVHLGILDNPAGQDQPDWSYRLRDGSLLLGGGGGSGRTTALEVIGAQVPATWSLVVWDFGDGCLQEKLRPRRPENTSSLFVDTANTRSVNHAVAQLAAILNSGESDEHPLLVLIDRIDLGVAVLSDQAESLTRLLTDGSQHGIYIVATMDPRLNMDSSLRRLFAREMKFDPSIGPGFLRDDEGRMISVYKPSITLGTPSSQSMPYRLGWPGREAWRSGETYVESEILVPVATEALMHRTVQISRHKSFAIVGNRRSGRSTTLLSLAERLSKEGNAVPIFASYTVPAEWDWAVDAWETLVVKNVHDNTVRLRNMAEWPAGVARVVIVDDAEKFKRHRRKVQDITLDAGNALTLERELGALLEEHQVPAFVSGTFAVVEDEYSDLGRHFYHANRRFITLQPPSEIGHNHGFGLVYRSLIKPIPGARYLPGEGVSIIGDRRDDVVIWANPEVIAFTTLIGSEDDEPYGR